MKKHTKFILITASLILSGFTSVVSEYANGLVKTSQYEIELVKNSSGVTFAQVIVIASGDKWDLPIRTDKLTYPLFEQIRFSSSGDRILIPIELALGCLFKDDTPIVVDGQKKRCFVLSVVDVKKKKEISRIDIGKDDVLKFNWMKTG